MHFSLKLTPSQPKVSQVLIVLSQDPFFLGKDFIPEDYNEC